MSFYNRMKAEDRAREIADLQSELDAIDIGIWPRDVNDDVRWGATRSFRDRTEKAAHVRPILIAEIKMLKDIPARIIAGELPTGWQV